MKTKFCRGGVGWSGVLKPGDAVKWEDYRAAFVDVWKALPSKKLASLSATAALAQVRSLAVPPSPSRFPLVMICSGLLS